MNALLKLRLAAVAPSLHFSTQKSVDETFQWDGDGPDPVKDGFYPHDVDVSVSAIVHGEMLSGHDYLGGCYYRPDEPVGDVHGYLLQMLYEAVEDLVTHLGDIPCTCHPVMECNAARMLIKQNMLEEYECQMAA